MAFVNKVATFWSQMIFEISEVQHLRTTDSTPLIFVQFTSNFLCICSDRLASAYVILRQIGQTLRRAVSREEKLQSNILKMIHL